MADRRAIPERINRDQIEWRVKSERVIATYHELLKDDGNWAVAVNLNQEVPTGTGLDFRQSLWCEQEDLNEIVKTGLVHEPAFEYQSGRLEEMKPAMREKIGPFDVSYIPRERKDGGRLVAIVVEQKEERGGEVPRHRFVCDLDRLCKFAGEGKEFERLLSEATRAYPVIHAEPTSLQMSDGRSAVARVKEWAPSIKRGEEIVQENANIPGAPKLALYPAALRTGTKSEIQVHHGIDGEAGTISRAIKDSCFDRHRDGKDYVVAHWDDLHRKPEAGMPCSYDGMKTYSSNGEMRDYGAHTRPKPGNEGRPEVKQYVLLKKNHESRLPFAATVEMVSLDRDAVEAEFCSREGLDLPLGKEGLGPAAPSRAPSADLTPKQNDLSQSDMPPGHRLPR